MQSVAHDEMVALLPALRRFAYSLTGTMADTDDLLQNTVERLLRKPIPDGTELAAWAFRVCRNVWIDEYRANQTRQKAVDEPALQQQNISDGERKVESEVNLQQVTAVMQELSEDQRMILTLVAVEGMPYKEVAATLEVPIGTVMSRLARARAALNEKLSAVRQE